MKHTSPICAHCSRIMTKVQSGISINVVAKFGSYYKVRADRWKCENCLIQIYDSFGEGVEHFTDGYKEIKTDVSVQCL